MKAPLASQNISCAPMFMFVPLASFAKAEIAVNQAPQQIRNNQGQYHFSEKQVTLLPGFERLWAYGETGQEKEQRHMDGIQNFCEHGSGRIPRELVVGRGMPEDDHEDRNAFCNINDLNSFLDLFFRHLTSPFWSYSSIG